jgi:uncharacterized protein YbaP (TraB family)
MRRLIIVFFVGLSWLATLPAWATDRGALFKLSGHGHTMVLFGTMHAGAPGFYPLEPRIVQAVAAAPVLALELDPDLQPLEVAEAIRRQGLLAPGTDGYRQLAAPKLAQLDGMLRKSALEPVVAHSFKPVLLATMLSVAEFEKIGFSAQLAVEHELARLAHEHKVPIVGLETIDSQLGALAQMPEPVQWRFLDEFLGDVASGEQEKESRAIVAAWANADQRAFDALADKLWSDKSVTAKFTREVLMEGRNGPLTDKIEELLRKSDKGVAAIGVMHLVGRRSVPELLGARGIKVERVY